MIFKYESRRAELGIYKNISENSVKVEQNSLVCFSLFFYQKISYAICTFKNLKNSGMIPKLKDEREGKEIEHGFLIEVMKKKIKSFPHWKPKFQKGK